MSRGMTRENHIYQLKQYLKGHLICMCPASSLYWEEHWEEVVKALEQEPTPKNDLGVDCISREQALRELKESAEHHANDSREEVLLRRDRDIIRALPSVTPQEPTTNDLTCAYAKGVYDTREETATIFDKIRAEIETEKLEDSPNFCIKAHNNAVDRVLQILDKYKTDRSEEDGNDN